VGSLVMVCGVASPFKSGLWVSFCVYVCMYVCMCVYKLWSAPSWEALSVGAVGVGGGL